MDTIIDAVDAMNKVAHILDYVSNQAKADGLSLILDACSRDLAQAAEALKNSASEGSGE